MASSEAPSGWVEQVLQAADLSVLLPKAMRWAEINGCRASDVDRKSAVDLAWCLDLKNVPSRRLIDTIMQAVDDKSLKDDDSCDPCLEVKPEDQDLDLNVESEADQDHPAPSPSAAPSCAAGPHLAALAVGQKSHDQLWCVTHDKMRDPTTMQSNSDGDYVCIPKHTCRHGTHSGTNLRQQRPTSHRQPARSPPSRRKRRRFTDSGERIWDDDDISSHIAGLGRYPEKSDGLRRGHDGSFSLDSLMTYWGHGAGLSIGTIQNAIQANLFKNIGRRKPILRFSISQGPDPRDLIMIKVPHPAGS